MTLLKVEARLANPWGRSVNIYLAEERNGRLYAVGETVVMHQVDEKDFGVIVEPTFSIHFEDVQALMDDLWNCGFRPSEGTGSAGALAATQKHLEDMRKLVFKDV